MQSLFDDNWNQLRNSRDTGAKLHSALLLRLTQEAQATSESDLYRWRGPSLCVEALTDPAGPRLDDALAAFDLEWIHGESLDRKGHVANGSFFLTRHRWIAAAMHGQLMILVDRLASLGALTEERLDSIGREAVSNLQTFIIPHLRGRGEQPILHEPINQGAAMIMGALYVGYLFGYRHRDWVDAQRLFDEACGQLQDHIGQFPPSGYDGDGFTYMRLIHHACLTYSVALLEDVTGKDWYFKRFEPNSWSLASLMERLLTMRCPSGHAWPLGRYGYVHGWNLPQLAYAAARTGNPAYLDMMSDPGSDEGRGRSPWLQMETALSLLWYPSELSKVNHFPSNRVRTAADDDDLPHLAVFQSPTGSGLYAVASALPESRPHLFAEFEGQPIVLGLDTKPGECNAVQFDGYAPPRKLWLQGGGTTQRRVRLPGFEFIDWDTTSCYADIPGVHRARRWLARVGTGRLLVEDQLNGEGMPSAYWQMRLHPDAVASPEGTGAQVPLNEGYQLCLQTTSTPDAFCVQSSMIEAHRRLLPDALEGRSSLATVRVDGGKTVRVQAMLDIAEADQKLTMESGAREVRWHGDGDSAVIREECRPDVPVEGWSTDAAWCMVSPDRVVLVGVTRASCRHRDIQMRCDTPCDLEFTSDTIAVNGIGYGGRLSVWQSKGYILLQRSNYVRVSARLAEKTKLCWPIAWGDALCNESPYRDEPSQSLNKPVWMQWQPPTDLEPQLLSQTVGALEAAERGFDVEPLIRGLAAVRRHVMWETAPVIRRLLSWDRTGTPYTEGDPRQTEGVNVRLEAARTLAMLGDRESVSVLIEVVERELNTNYADCANGDDPWPSQFWGSGVRVASLEAIGVLGTDGLAPRLASMLEREVVPHARHALQRLLTQAGW